MTVTDSPSNDTNPTPSASEHGRVRSSLTRLQDGGLAGDTAWGLVLEIANLFSTLLAFVLLGRELDTVGYGDYVGLYAVIAPLGTLAVSGVTLSLMQHVLRDEESLRTTLRSCLSITFVLGSALTVIGVLVASRIIPTLALTTIAAIILMEFISQPIAQLAATTVQVRLGFASAARMRLLPIALRMTILITLKLTDRLTLTTLGVTHLIWSSVLAFLMLQDASRRIGISMKPGKIQSRHLRTSGIYSIGIFGLSMQNDGDKLVLAANNFRDANGLYGAAYRIVQFGLLPVGTLVNVSHQRFLKHTDGDKSQHMRRSIQFAGVTAAYGIVFALGVYICAPMLGFLLGDKFADSIQMVRWLTPLVVLRGLAIFPLNGLMGLGKTALRTGLLLGSAALSMLLYVILVPRMTWKGAALGTVIGEAFLALAAWWLLIVYQRRDDDQSRQTELAELIRKVHLAGEERRLES